LKIKESEIMGKYQSRKKKLIACAVIMSVQMQAVLPCYMAAAAPQAAPPVVNIAKPNESGLSHNKADAFNVGPEGLVFNNNASGGNVNTALAGQVGANANLGGNAAKVILQEVTGTGRSNLNGMMEIAGSKADLIIANPNGITGSGFGFINVGRATLTTGTPRITADGRVEGFDVNGGKIAINGAGNMPVFDETTGTYKYVPVSKLDIYANAAEINAQLWAQDEINVVTGKNKIDYAAGTATAQPGSAGSGVSLDVGALGGMYAGRITLVGTNKGLGMNIGGNLNAQKNLNITNDGQIVFTENKYQEIDEDGNQYEAATMIHSDGAMRIDASNADIENGAMLTARENINIELGGTLTNTGKIIAGEEYEQTEESDIFQRDSADLSIKAAQGIINTGLLDASNNLSVTAAAGDAALGGTISALNNIDLAAAKAVDIKGSVFSANGTIAVTGAQVKYSKENLQTQNPEQVTILETDPEKPAELPPPEPPREAEDLTNPELADTAGVAGTVQQDKISDSELALVADSTADGKYKPIIDKAANGVDLVQIAEVNSNGVSRNLYSDFNIKSSGLILNNATKYTQTELGGYIDRNMFLTGKGARVILNEVTSSKASVLNGYLEVAGNSASVVIANANGISVNGLGFINTDNVVLATGKVTNWADGNMKFSAAKGDLLINGDGLNGRDPGRLDLIADNITIDRSELWGNELHISADGLLANTSKIGGSGNVDITAGSIENTANGYIEAGKDLTLAAAGLLQQNQATSKAGGDLNVSAGSINNEAASLLGAGGNLTASAAANFDNTGATIMAGAKVTISADSFANSSSALVNGTDLQLQAERLTNDNANIYLTGSGNITAGQLTNQNMGTIHIGKDAVITADTLLNTKAAVDVLGNLSVQADSFTNTDSAYLGAGQKSDFTTGSFTNSALGSIFVSGGFTADSTGDFTNDDGLLALGSTGSITAQNIYNQNGSSYYNGSVISAAGDLTLTARETLLNRSSDIESKSNITINAADLINKKENFVTDWDVTYEYISYKIPHLQGGDYYDAMREFIRTIHTGVIKEETADANIIASGNITINADHDVTNHYSKIMAGNDLTIDAGGTVENVGYQGTIHHDDLGEDNHYWKYKKHRRLHIGCHMVYGTTVIPYEDHNVYDQDAAPGSERLAVLGATGTVKINAGNVVNKTLEADGSQYADRDKTVSTDVDDKLTGNSAAERKPLDDNKLLAIDQLQYNNKIYQLNDDPSARYLIETNPKFADYHQFLSSDYLLERVKADPEKVAKRLGDGYFEQQFVIEQIGQLTGRPYLGSYGSDMEQFQALMNAGAVAAEALNLEIGVSLTAQQVASLTSDIVWLVETTVNGQKVLVPQVYLAAVRSEDLQPGGALIVGGDVEIYSKQDIQNVGTIKADGTLDLHGQNVSNLGGSLAGNDIAITAADKITNQGGSITAQHDAALQAHDIINETTTQNTTYKELQQTTAGKTAGITAGNDLRLEAAGDITNKGGVLAADNDLTLSAGQNINITTVANEKHVAVTYGSSAAEIHSVENQQSALTGKNVSLTAGSDVNIKGGIIAAAEDTAIKAGGDVNIAAVKDLHSEESSVGSRGSNYYNHSRQVDETVKGSLVAGTENITVSSGSDINLQGSSLASEKGKIELDAGSNVNITNATEYHERLQESHTKVSGVLSSKTTDIYDYSNLDAVVGSTVSGSVVINSGADTNVKGSSVVADNDVSIKAGGDLNVTSAEQTSTSEYIKQVKKSGLLSGGGLGFTIGKEQQKDQYANQNTEQVGSTIGSINGNVNIEAGKDVSISASDVIAGQDINVTGQNVTIKSADNTYNAQEKHEYKKSGITVSLGTPALSVAQSVHDTIKKADSVKDDRLKALIVGKEVSDLTKNGKDSVLNQTNNGLQDGFNADDFTLTVSIGSQKYKNESNSSTTIAQGSSVQAGGNVKITATEKDINIKGSSVSGENVDLAAKGDVNITSSDNINTANSESKGSSSSLGLGFNTSGLSDISAGYSKYNGKVKENGTTHTNSTVTANDKLTIESGKDTNIIGGKVSGDSVEMNVGGDLNIESQQDSQNYDEKYTSGGLNVNINYATGVGVSGGASSGKTNSEYNSVTDQSGIYAGEGGFDITVGNNTDLKGAVIDSDATADKNNLTTGTLTWEDIDNKAEYESKDTGINVSINNGAEQNEKGITPNIGMPAEGEAESTTKAGVAQGTIEITDKENQKQNIEDLNRDTKNTLNQLEQIFDKQTVAERKEMAALFGELAYNVVHNIDGTPEQKAALHALVGGIMSELTGSGFLAGASGAAVNKLLSDELKKIADGDPALHQWLSAALGAVVSDVVAGNAQAGSSAAASGTKNNDLMLTPEELSELVFDNDRAEEYCKQQGIPATQENIDNLKTGFTNFVEENSESDAVIATGGFGVEGSYIYDLKAQESYLAAGGSGGKGAIGVALSLVAIKIVSSDPSIDLNDAKVRKEILSGTSIGANFYVGVGGGISIPLNSQYSGRITIIVKGIGTPQVGISGSNAQAGSDIANDRHNEALDNKYGSD
jgi:filamentous hemagglutinin family protein